MDCKKELTLPRAETPESVGISSKAFISFIKELEEIKYNYHSLTVIKNGVIAAECYRYPFNADVTHCMYSISKHVTATALGFAVFENKVSLDTKLCEIFPEKAPKCKDEYYNEINIRHLVTMTSGKAPSALLNKSKGDWFEHYTESARKYPPGTTFQYVNESFFVLSACLKKVLGEGINDYLTPRLWEPLGIEKPFWETDKNGIEAGGWGIQLKTEDLAKLALCYANGGKLFGKQIIPEKWAKEAVINRAPLQKVDMASYKNGYGYSVWTCPDGVWHLEGMFGQEAHVFPDKDLILVLTSADPLPERKEPIFRKYSELLVNGENAAAASFEEYKKFVGSRRIDEYSESTLRSPLERELEGKTVRLKRHRILNAIGFPLGVLSPASVFMSKSRAGDVKELSLSFIQDGCFFKWSEGEEENKVFCPMNGSFHADPIRLAQIDFTAYSSAKWLKENLLEITVRPMQSIAKRTLLFNFKKNKVTVAAAVSPSVEEVLLSVANIVTNKIKSPFIQNLFTGIIRKVSKALEPKTRGKIL